MELEPIERSNLECIKTFITLFLYGIGAGSKNTNIPKALLLHYSYMELELAYVAMY